MRFALLLLAACSASPPASTASPPPEPDAAPAQGATSTPTPAPTPAPPTANERDDGGFADPRVAEESAAPPVPKAMTEPALVARVKQRFGDSCRPERSCGALLGVDCDAAVDGPYYYVKLADLELLSTCGGACMSGACTDCPPRAWTCATY